jgi:hypothetical protein
MTKHDAPKTQAPTTFRAWLREALDLDQITDLANHGADAGWPGLTYTADCVDLYLRFEKEIHEALVEDAEAFGYKSPEVLIAAFHRADMLWTADGRKNLLVWYLAERTARDITDEKEDA